MEVRKKTFSDEDLIKSLRQRKKELKSLALFGTSVTDQGILSLSGRTDLETLHISSKIIGNAVMRCAQTLPNLKELLLSGVPCVNDQGLEMIQDVTNLRGLYLEKTSITDCGLLFLKKLKNLWSLVLKKTKISDNGFEIFEHLPKISLVEASYTVVSGSGLRYFAGKKRLDLYLSSSCLCDENFCLGISGLDGISTLDLCYNKISDRSIALLSGLESLSDLRLSGTQVTEKVLDIILSFNRKMIVYLQDVSISSNKLIRFKEENPQLCVYI